MDRNPPVSVLNDQDGAEDLEATLPSSQFSERGDLLIPSTVLIRRMREEVEHERRAQEGESAELQIQDKSEEQTGRTNGSSAMHRDQPETDVKMDVDISGNPFEEHDTAPVMPFPFSPLPPSSFCFDVPQSSISEIIQGDGPPVPNMPNIGPGANGSEAKEAALQSEDMDGVDEFDDPWFDAACLAEVDEGDTLDEAHTIGEGEDGEIRGSVQQQDMGRAAASVDQPKPKANGGGFVTAGGSALPDVSAAAKARIQAMFKDEDLAERIEAPERASEEDDDIFDKMDDSGFDDLLDEQKSGAGRETADAADYDAFAEVGGFLDAGAFGEAQAGFGFGGGAGAGGGGGGFTTAKGKKLAAPSAAAAARAMKLFADEVVDEALLVGDELPVIAKPGTTAAASEQSSAFSFATAGGNQLAPPTAAARAAASALFAEEEATSTPAAAPAGGSMFATASGNKLSGPSTAATAIVTRLFAHEAVVAGGGDGLENSIPSIAEQSAFATASGMKLPPPSKAASDRISRLFFDEEERAVIVESKVESKVEISPGRTGTTITPKGTNLVMPSAVAGKSSFDTSNSRLHGITSPDREGINHHGPKLQGSVPQGLTAKPSSSSMFATSSGSSLSGISEEAKARAAAIFAEEAVPETPKLKRHLEYASSPTIGPLRDTTNTPRRTAFKSPTMNLSKPYGRPGGTPLKHSTGFSQASGTPVQASPLLAKRVGIGLGMTPRAKNTLAMRPKFNSPLKKMAGGGAVAPLKLGRNHAPSMLGPATRDRKASPAVATERSCFDMNTRPPRQDMLASHLHPHYFSVSELMELDIPEEIWAVNPSNARYYQFMVDDSVKGPDDALAGMQFAGCLRATSQWVNEHWTMILWKLASLIRAKPGLFAEKWTYHEVFRQLLYRYEREMNLAHRSAIKRIQEQDSPASLPMVLCVSAIMLPEPAVDENGTAIEVHPVLELTDGWYRIRANTDATLGRAILAGRLQVGYKIAIVGARLEATREGTEVLDAIEKSRLSISGNSTSMAEWSARLGFVQKPFIASLPSLTKDGGVIAMMDIRIKKVFPLAYMSSKRGEHVAPWSAAEEFTQQDQWKEKYSQERTRLTQDLQARIAMLEDDVGRVNAASEGLMEGAEADESVDGEIELEKYRQALNKGTYLRGLRPHVLSQLSMALHRDYRYECEQGVLEIETQMQRLCPVRETRSFQVIRFEDSQIYQKERCRIGQLQVWDAHTLGDGALTAGMRFMILNLVPAQAHAWCGPRDQGEIFLSTKRDTIWRRLEET